MSVYFIRCTASGLIKIGVSGQPLKRLVKMQSDAPGELVLLGLEPGGAERERQLHDMFAGNRQRGEWFRPSDDLLAHVSTLSVPPKTKKVYDPATSPTRLAAAVGITKGHASNMLSGKRTPGLDLALRIFGVTGLKLGDVAELSDADVETVRAIFAKRGET